MQSSIVESIFLKESNRQRFYQGENVPSIEVENIYQLGKLVALRFLEWVIAHPLGVVALPTGKTPEYFIKTLEFYKNNWSTREVRDEIQKYGIPTSAMVKFPDTTGLTFVMLDEFFPMPSSHKNSFCHYVSVFYTSVLGKCKFLVHDVTHSLLSLKLITYNF